MSGREKLLITGGLGNLGSWLTYHFSEKFDVYVLSKSVKSELACDYKVIQCDITNSDELQKKLNIEFDYCIHTASYNEFFHEGYAKQALLINTLGTRNLIEALKDTKIKNFIYLSTFHVYGATKGIITEESTVSPKNDYASTHLFAEYYLKQFFSTHNFHSIIFRLTNSYGTPQYKNSTKWYLVLNDLVKSAYNEHKIILKGNGKAIRDFIWMGDVCTCIEKALFLQEHNLFNLSSTQTLSMLDLAKKVQKIYLKKYSNKIPIELNNEDKTEVEYLRVENSKLLSKIDLKFHDKFDKEIEKIFNLLEKSR